MKDKLHPAWNNFFANAKAQTEQEDDEIWTGEEDDEDDL